MTTVRILGDAAPSARAPWPRIAVCGATHDNRTMTVTYSGGMETMDIKRSGSQPSTKGRTHILPATCGLIRASRQLLLGVSLALA
jgi:hypothetical protein